MKTLLLLFSHIIANAPARPPAKAACHLLVCFLTNTNWARVDKEKRAFRFPTGAKCSSKLRGSASSSSIADAERDVVVPGGFIAGIRIGSAFIKNLYKEVNVPEHTVRIS